MALIDNFIIGRPDAVLKCISTDSDVTSFSINCIPGYDGGLHQSFILELFDNKMQNLLHVITDSTQPVFRLSNLQSGSDYIVKVFAINIKGKSDAFVLKANTSSPPITATEGNIFDV